MAAGDPPYWGGQVFPPPAPIFWPNQQPVPAAPAVVQWTTPIPVPPRLTDEEVWLGGWAAKIGAGAKLPTAEQYADATLKAFRKRFPKEQISHG